MADYHPLIARAVQGLPDQSPAMRAAVYDRARAALLDQLRSLDPPLSDEDIARESAALDQAIARVEADFMPLPEPEPEPFLEPEPPPPPAAFRAPRPRDDRPDPRPYDPEPADAAEPPAEAQNFTLPEGRRRPDFDALVASAPAPAPSEPKRRPRIDPAAGRRGGGGFARVAVIGAVLAVVVGAIAATAYSLRPDPAALVAEAPAPAAEPAAAGDGKIAERLGAPAPASAPTLAAGQTASAAPTAPPAAAFPAPAPAAEAAASATIPVAQRAVLYEEDPINPQGEPRAAAGRAVWQITPGGQGDPAVRATVEIADPPLRLELVIRRNLDPTLPASHTIDLAFETGAMESRRVRDIGLLQLKDEETVRGAPLHGLPVPVRDNLFLIGLSNLPRDVERNAALLAQRNWIDLPIRLASGQRAILSFEKGNSGAQALAQAQAAWGEAGVRTTGN